MSPSNRPDRATVRRRISVVTAVVAATGAAVIGGFAARGSEASATRAARGDGGATQPAPDPASTDGWSAEDQGGDGYGYGDGGQEQDGYGSGYVAPPATSSAPPAVMSGGS